VEDSEPATPLIAAFLPQQYQSYIESIPAALLLYPIDAGQSLCLSMEVVFASSGLAEYWGATKKRRNAQIVARGMLLAPAIDSAVHPSARLRCRRYGSN
jgi:hypothetical protein